MNKQGWLSGDHQDGVNLASIWHQSAVNLRVNSGKLPSSSEGNPVGIPLFHDIGAKIRP